MSSQQPQDDAAMKDADAGLLHRVVMRFQIATPTVVITRGVQRDARARRRRPVATASPVVIAPLA